MDPELTQQILLDDSDAFTKSPLYDNVLGRAGGKGLLIAEGDDWRWQRRIAAPLFRAEALLSYVPAFAAACEPVLARWRKAYPPAPSLMRITRRPVKLGQRRPGAS